MIQDILNNYRCLMEKLQPLLRPEDVSVMKKVELLAAGKKIETPVANGPGQKKPSHRERVSKYL